MHALVAAGAQWVLVLAARSGPATTPTCCSAPAARPAPIPGRRRPTATATPAAATAITAMLARGLEMPEAVRQGLAHADAAVASSFLPGMGRRIPYRIQPQ